MVSENTVSEKPEGLDKIDFEKQLEEMRQDGTSLKIIKKYLDDPQKYLEVDDLGY